MAICTTSSASQLQSSFIRLDAEFFKPEYMEVARRLNTIPGIIQLGRITDRITQGSNPHFVTEGLPCVNGKNVYFGTMLSGEPNYVSVNEFERLSGYTLRRNDLVITLKHATKVGRVWIVEDDDPRIFSRNIGLIRLRGESPIRHSVLLLYLWTKAGQLLIDRCATGGTTGQITLPMSELRRLPIPPISTLDQDEIAEMFFRSRSSASCADSEYESASKLLESELELDELKQDPARYSAQFSNVRLSETLVCRRVDAQCFAPEALLYSDWLLSHAKCDCLGSLVLKSTKGRQQIELPGGSTDYCSIKHISDRELAAASKCNAASHTPTARADDILLAITGATIGKLGIVKRYSSLAFSGDLLCLRTSSAIDPNYLLLVLDHKLGQIQFNRWITGSTNGHLAPRDVARVLVPRLASDIEVRIADLVKNSFVKRRESEELLEQAKTRVEQLIEEAVQK